MSLSTLFLILFLTLFLIVPLLLFFILTLQAVYLKKNAIRLPEAHGLRYSVKGSDISLLHIGESPVAGVGVIDIEDGMTFKLVNFLANKFKQSIDWEILAENGAKVEAFSSRVSKISEPSILILTFGVNDTSKFSSLKNWEANIVDCVEQFKGKETAVFLTSVPSMEKFPLLPFPLNQLLGLKAKSLDNKLKSICKQYHWHYIESELKPTAEWMAKDGYHPNEKGYTLWSEIIGQHILSKLDLDKASASHSITETKL